VHGAIDAQTHSKLLITCVIIIMQVVAVVTRQIFKDFLLPRQKITQDPFLPYFQFTSTAMPFTGSA